MDRFKEDLSMQITIDTHRFVKFLSEKKHFTQEQAEVLIEAATEYHNAYTKELATKQDLLDVKKELKNDINLVKQELMQKIEASEARLEFKILAVKSELKDEIAKVSLGLETLTSDVKTLALALTIRLGIAMFTILLAFKMLDRYLV